MQSQENDKSVFVWGHYGQKLEQLDKDRFRLLAEKNPHVALSRLYNIKIGKLISKIYEIKESKIKDSEKIEKINEILNDISTENLHDKIFREANKLMLGLGDSVSFGSMVAGEFESKIKHGKIVVPKEKVEIE